MNYRHSYHAGNFADVVKHAVLALIIGHLKQKETPFAFVDCHAGIGVYDLGGVEAGKTLEYTQGIDRFMAEPPPPEAAGYVGVVQAMAAGDQRLYPGSPEVAARLARPQDRLVLVELHPEDARLLRRQYRGDPRVAVHERDAYEALEALLPPKERRGLVLLDPPFEVRDEFERVVDGLRQALRRWRTGVYVAWYPIKDRPPVAAFHAALAALPVSEILAAEMLVFPDDYAARLNGCGLVVLNPPWRLDETLGRLLPEMHRRLQRQGGGARVAWVKRSEGGSPSPRRGEEDPSA